jgi:hypothetical protein
MIRNYDYFETPHEAYTPDDCTEVPPLSLGLPTPVIREGIWCP